MENCRWKRFGYQKTQGAGREGFKWGKSLEVFGLERLRNAEFKRFDHCSLTHMISFVGRRASALPRVNVLNFKRWGTQNGSKNYRLEHARCNFGTKRKSKRSGGPPLERSRLEKSKSQRALGAVWPANSSRLSILIQAKGLGRFDTRPLFASSNSTLLFWSVVPVATSSVCGPEHRWLRPAPGSGRRCKVALDPEITWTDRGRAESELFLIAPRSAPRAALLHRR